MNKGLESLSKVTIFQKYAKYLPFLERRETWDEIVTRYKEMMLVKYSKELKDKALMDLFCNAITMVREKKILPSMRALQFAGAAIERNESRIYNCCYMPVDSIYSFSEAMFLLLGGTGVGYSVQFHHIEKLPEIRKPLKERKFLVSDSIEGWADAVKALVKSYMGGSSTKPRFDFSDIRPKGARLITAGGKAPGPEPLKVCLFHIETILERKKDGEKLTSLECHDILCHIANAVLAGGIRRAAMIALFSFDDEEMLSCKSGAWYELNEQRGRANNSVVINRRRIKKGEFESLWNKIKLNRSGEPGLFFTNDRDWGTNPCAEIALRPFQFCNLCEINGSDIVDMNDFIERAKYAAVLGTMQAGFTDFHYLRPIWQKTTEKDALLGIGITGIASNKVNPYDLSKAHEAITETNTLIAKLLNINTAARTTCVKPSGTTSCVLGTSSGIHSWHNGWYLRTMRIGKNEALYEFLNKEHPYMLEDDVFRPETQAIVKFPITIPIGSITREESALDFLERVQLFNEYWIKPGHRLGENTHNISATITIKDDEWDIVKNWIWNHRDSANGLSILPYDGGTYVQAPFQDLTEAQYNKLIKQYEDINLSKVIEIDDSTNFTQEAACSGGACTI